MYILTPLINLLVCLSMASYPLGHLRRQDLISLALLLHMRLEDQIPYPPPPHEATRPHPHEAYEGRSPHPHKAKKPHPSVHACVLVDLYSRTDRSRIQKEDIPATLLSVLHHLRRGHCNDTYVPGHGVALPLPAVQLPITSKLQQHDISNVHK